MSTRLKPALLVRSLWMTVAAGLGYYGAATLGLQLFALPPGDVTAIWPAAGIALAAVLLWGYRVAPGIWLAAFAIHLGAFLGGPEPLPVGPAILVALVQAGGETGEALLGAVLLHRVGSVSCVLDQPRGIVRLAVLAGAVSCGLNATIGVTALALGGLIPWADYRFSWVTWWLGDIAGILVVTPLLLAWSAPPWRAGQQRRLLEAALLGTLLLGVSMLVFDLWLPGRTALSSQAYLTLPFLIWAAFRFGVRGATTSVATVAAIAVWGTVLGAEPLAGRGAAATLLSLQAFVAVVALVILALAASLETNRRAEEALRESEVRFRGAFDHAAVGMALLAPEGGWLQVNPAFCALVGYTADELRATTFQALTHPDDLDAGLEYARQLLDGECETYQMEKRYVHRRGHSIWALVSASLVPDGAGRPLYFIAQAQDITARKNVESQLRHQATHDPLTDLPNRTLFLERLRRALTPPNRREGAVAVLFLDLDRFKVVNDSLGHEVGDQFLVQVGARLRRCLRARDVLARFGGDEFTILLRHVQDAGEVTAVAERLGAALQAPIVVDGRELTTTASIGIVLHAPDGASAETILRDADIAMYIAKARGPGRYAVFDPGMSTAAVVRLELEQDLRRALERGELRLRYQPKVELKTGRVAGFEALVRWEHPERGLVPAAEFIPLAEETGLIMPLGRWVLEEACEQARAWREGAGVQPVPLMCVNLSAAEFGHPTLTEDVAAILDRHALPPGSLELEITESVVMADAAAATTTLQRLKNLGVGLAIDDFGTGYSSLAYLKRFPVDILKIDRAFVVGLGRDPRDTALVGAMVTLARALGLGVVAEGVETADQAARLRDLGCDLGQGYHFARPLPPDEAWALLGAGGRDDPARHALVAAGVAAVDEPRPGAQLIRVPIG